jgi:hypothetical protein
MALFPVVGPDGETLLVENKVPSAQLVSRGVRLVVDGSDNEYYVVFDPELGVDYVIDDLSSTPLTDFLTGLRLRQSRAKASLLKNPSGADNAILWTSVHYGVRGESVTVAYTVPADDNQAHPLALTMTGAGTPGDPYDIVCQLEVDTDGSTILTTANDLITAVRADADISAVVGVALDNTDADNDGTGVLTTSAEGPLAGSVG